MLGRPDRDSTNWLTSVNAIFAQSRAPSRGMIGRHGPAVMAVLHVGEVRLPRCHWSSVSEIGEAEGALTRIHAMAGGTVVDEQAPAHLLSLPADRAGRLRPGSWQQAGRRCGANLSSWRSASVQGYLVERNVHLAVPSRCCRNRGSRSGSRWRTRWTAANMPHPPHGQRVVELLDAVEFVPGGGVVRLTSCGCMNRQTPGRSDQARPACRSR